MKKQSRILFVMLFAVVLVGCKKKDAATPAQVKRPVTVVKVKNVKPMVQMADDEVSAAVLPSKIGDKAWPLAGLEFVKGKPVKIEPGKVHIVEFWATWCGPCRTSIPRLTEIAHKYKDKNVVVVGISTEDAAVVRPFVDKQGDTMDYYVAVDPARNVHKGYMKAYRFGGIPHAFIVDGEGKVVWHGHPMAEVEEVLDHVLAGTFDAITYAEKKAEKRAEQKAKYEASMKTFKAYFEKIRGEGTAEEAAAILGDWIDDASDRMLNSLAWEILTGVEEGKRDKALALKAAERANTLTEGKDAHILDTYALALFQNGRVKEAIAAQEKALEGGSKSRRMETDMQKRLAKYRSAVKQ